NSSDSTFSFDVPDPAELTIAFSDESTNTGYSVEFSLPVGDTLSLSEAYFYQYLFKSDAASLKLTAGMFGDYSAAFKFGLEGTVGDTTLGIGPVLYLKDGNIAFDINDAYVSFANLGFDVSVAVYDVTSATPSIDLNASLDTSAFSDLQFIGSVYVSAAGGAAPDINEVDVSLSYTYDPYTLSLDLTNTKADSGFETSVDAGVSYSTELPVIGPVDLSVGLSYSMAAGLENVSVSADWTKELISHSVSVTFYPEKEDQKAYAELGWTGSFSF
ncbi:MAG: hypothetical protein ACXQTT_02645, partial [Candidatus Syntropharchaeia archaeon]